MAVSTLGGALLIVWGIAVLAFLGWLCYDWGASNRHAAEEIRRNQWRDGS